MSKPIDVSGASPLRTTMVRCPGFSDSGRPTTATQRPSERNTIARWPSSVTTGAACLSRLWTGKINTPPGTREGCGNCALAAKLSDAVANARAQTNTRAIAGMRVSTGLLATADPRAIAPVAVNLTRPISVTRRSLLPRHTRLQFPSRETGFDLITNIHGPRVSYQRSVRARHHREAACECRQRTRRVQCVGRKTQPVLLPRVVFLPRMA